MNAKWRKVFLLFLSYFALIALLAIRSVRAIPHTCKFRLKPVPMCWHQRSPSRCRRRKKKTGFCWPLNCCHCNFFSLFGWTMLDTCRWFCCLIMHWFSTRCRVRAVCMRSKRAWCKLTLHTVQMPELLMNARAQTSARARARSHWWWWPYGSINLDWL